MLQRPVYKSKTKKSSVNKSKFCVFKIINKIFTFRYNIYIHVI